jgi:hypothetical protein
MERRGSGLNFFLICHCEQSEAIYKRLKQDCFVVKKLPAYWQAGSASPFEEKGVIY